MHMHAFSCMRKPARVLGACLAFSISPQSTLPLEEGYTKQKEASGGRSPTASRAAQFSPAFFLTSTTSSLLCMHACMQHAHAAEFGAFSVIMRLHACRRQRGAPTRQTAKQMLQRQQTDICLVLHACMRWTEQQFATLRWGEKRTGYILYEDSSGTISCRSCATSKIYTSSGLASARVSGQQIETLKLRCCLSTVTSWGCRPLTKNVRYTFSALCIHSKLHIHPKKTHTQNPSDSKTNNPAPPMQLYLYYSKSETQQSAPGRESSRRC